MVSLMQLHWTVLFSREAMEVCTKRKQNIQKKQKQTQSYSKIIFPKLANFTNGITDGMILHFFLVLALRLLGPIQNTL